MQGGKIQSKFHQTKKIQFKMLQTNNLEQCINVSLHHTHSSRRNHCDLFLFRFKLFKRKSRFLGPWQGCRRTEGELRDRKCLNVIISLSGWHLSGILSLPSCRFDSIRVSLLAKLVTWLPASGLPETFLGSENVFFASSCSEAHFAQKALQCSLVMWPFSSLIKNVSYCEKYTCPQQMFTSLI